MATGSYMTPIYPRSQSEVLGDLHNCSKPTYGIFTSREIKLSDNGPQFISDIFEHLSNRLGIRNVKTVVYRPQANRTERVNRDLVHMIANYVNDRHDTSDQFLREFAHAIRTAVNETTEKPLQNYF
ncbi:retrovirus-related Pol polyprotein from transposon 17.6 [Trichonephila clavipes]|nr:retrovirus-related Pol polyprotein from transposon 17.6 [Trichonephila clavipes]